jgi:hypothetical protein
MRAQTMRRHMILRAPGARDHSIDDSEEPTMAERITLLAGSGSMPPFARGRVPVRPAARHRPLTDDVRARLHRPRSRENR